ncbi:transposase [Halorhodospira neutriphila]|uniref:transposase n=1 Tax=Halorhodospira neutriphila TaxID=168379 RepID=UPI001906F68D
MDRNAMAPIRQRAVQAVHESRPVAGASCRGRCAGAALAAEVGAVVEAWERERYPEIRRQARKAGARIYFADEASLCLNYYAGTTSAPACQTLVLCDTGWHLRVNMLSAVDPRGSMRFKVHIGTVNVGVFIAFLQRLMHDAEGPVFVIVDGYPAHRAKKVQRFVASTEGRLRLFFLPPYAPHLNPDEAVWAHVKREAGKQAPGSTGEMLALARSVPHRIQRMPRLVRSFFHQPECQYILANQTGNT